ncbi:YcfL family protein [Vibrio tritonius]|uniref:YcfL family protein n=1 Tax=Vibrio tritonius TaxID=1435069 RepID=A0ABS7YTX6_9VIBR|nr:YcfL family protein [Vibrio tritonius]MCA2019135.1 YcfL family protein [Vibrio tritonius]
MKKWLGALIAIGLLAGCAENTAGLQVDGANQQVLFGDHVLGDRLRVEDITTTQLNGHARGVVRLTSHYKGDQFIQYRFYWYDAQGLEVNTRPSAWQQAIVRGGEGITLSEVSIKPNGTQFRVQIRQFNQ